MTPQSVALAAHTTFQVGGVTDQFYTVTTEDELHTVFTTIDKEATPFILGGGSNVLVADTLPAMPVIKMALQGRKVTPTKNGVLLTVAAGEVFDEVVAYTVENEYWGLENLSHIPGSVGAAPVQNVGAYGVEVADCIESVRVYDRTRAIFTELTPDECQFAYRDSVFKHPTGSQFVVTALTFSLHSTPTPHLQYRDLAEWFVDNQTPSLLAVREAVIAIRAAKFPNWREVGTAGSFFKNPTVPKAQFEELRRRHPELPGYEQTDGSVKIALGWVLDKILHLKGAGTTTVGCYEGQALVVINRGGATAAEIKKFADEIVEKVYDAIGVEIEWEVTPLGF